MYRNVFKPSASYNFPKTKIGSSKRSCCYKYLKDFPWAAYSPSLDGLFCVPCALFGHQFRSKNSRVSILYSSSLRDWSSATKRLREHEGSHKTQNKFFDGLHKYSVEALSKLLADFSGKSDPVEAIIDRQVKSRIQENREKLKPIIETVVFLGRNGLAFRGHKDSSEITEFGSFGENRSGLFVESLNFRVMAGNKNLEGHLKRCPKKCFLHFKNNTK